MSTTNQYISEVNKHIEDYLDYYCGLSESPKYAILLKGEWGSGKTWFIEEYREKLKARDKKSLYVSLHGVTDISQIEKSFFQQLHPVFTSKNMVLARKLALGLFKTTFRFDFGHDSDNSLTFGYSVSDKLIEENFDDSSVTLLVFDDLERCKIPVVNILGYINSFFESQTLKIVIIANESRLKQENNEYAEIKEKLIGKSFEMFLDLPRVFDAFVNKNIPSKEAKICLLDYSFLIENLYEKSGCKNLRILNQVILDFARIFERLPERAKKYPELLQEILEILTIFSIEIYQGKLEPLNISKISEGINTEMSLLSIKAQTHKGEAVNLEENGDVPFLEIFEKYDIIRSSRLHASFPDLSWWQEFFDKGILDKLDSEEFLFNSKYFSNREQAEAWIRLWNYTNRTDEEFDQLLKEVDSDYTNRKFIDIGVIKHVTGLFLLFSRMGLYNRKPSEILDEAKKYIDDLSKHDKLDYRGYFSNILHPDIVNQNIVYKRLEFQEKHTKEFQDFCEYIEECYKQARIKNISNEVREVLDAMKNNITEFQFIMCLTNSNNLFFQKPSCYDYPILKHLPPKEFVETLLMRSNEDQRYIFHVLKKRYTQAGNIPGLAEELIFLEEIQEILKNKASQNEGKLSGYLLSKLRTDNLQEAIDELKKHTGS